MSANITPAIAVSQTLPVGAVDKRATGWWAMLFVILTEGALFAYLLFSYYYLAVQPQPSGYFPQGGAPSMHLALPDTIILLLSSFTAAWAQKSIEYGKQNKLLIGLSASIALGTIFLIIQYIEWVQKKFALASSPYSSLYYTITGFHMAHVAIGVLMLMAVLLWSSLGKFNRVHHGHIRVTILYWHFVDAVWLTIFFTFYITPLLGLHS